MKYLSLLTVTDVSGQEFRVNTSLIEAVYKDAEGKSVILLGQLKVVTDLPLGNILSEINFNNKIIMGKG